MFPINVVEKETNISKYLLRMWERRYSFPRPERDSKGERVYTADDVEKLKLIKRLMEEGYRPSKVIAQGLSELRELSKSFHHEVAQESHNFVVVVTTKDLLVNVQEALKNQKVEMIISAFSPEDIKNITL